MAGEDDMDFLVQRKFEYRMLDFSDQAVREEIREMRMMILERDRIGVLAVSNPLFVKGAFEGEKLIGVIEVATDGHVNYMVHPDYRGLKIATNLLNQAIDDARDRWCEQISGERDSWFSYRNNITEGWLCR